MPDEQPDKENQDNDDQKEHPREKPTHPFTQKTIWFRRIQALSLLVLIIAIIVLNEKYPWLVTVAVALLVLFLPVFIFYSRYLITGFVKTKGLWIITILWFFFSICAALVILIMPNAQFSTENRCKLALYALGLSELSYKEMNNNNYATFENLVENGYIEKGYNPDNLIEKYQIVFFNTKPNKINKRGKIVESSSFTIVAIQQNQRNRLRTFALDDQSKYIWVGDSNRWEKGKASLHDISYWDPLR